MTCITSVTEEDDNQYFYVWEFVNSRIVRELRILNAWHSLTQWRIQRGRTRRAPTPFLQSQPVYTYLQPLGQVLERKKTRAQTEPKSLPPYAFPGLQSSKYAKIRRAREERGKGRGG